MKKLFSLKNSIVSFGILLFLWQAIYAFSHFDASLFPSPLQAGKALLELIHSGILFASIKASLYRFAVGYFSAIVTAILLGLLLGWFQNVFQYINPIVQLLRLLSMLLILAFLSSGLMMNKGARTRWLLASICLLLYGLLAARLLLSAIKPKTSSTG